MQDLSLRHVDDADRVVAEFGDKEAMMFEIEGEMVYSAGDVAERDLALEGQGVGRRRKARALIATGQCRRQQRQNREFGAGHHGTRLLVSLTSTKAWRDG